MGPKAPGHGPPRALVELLEASRRRAEARDAPRPRSLLLRPPGMGGIPRVKKHRYRVRSQQVFENHTKTVSQICLYGHSPNQSLMAHARSPTS
eukprot:6201706-Pleurochrysis_carterae.AAC.1